MDTKEKVGWTTGPWHLHDMEAFTVCGADHLAIALCDAKSRSIAENGANTFLISKCPTMVALLRELARINTNGYSYKSIAELATRAEKLLTEIGA